MRISLIILYLLLSGPLIAEDRLFIHGSEIIVKDSCDYSPDSGQVELASGEIGSLLTCIDSSNRTYFIRLYSDKAFKADVEDLRRKIAEEFQRLKFAPIETKQINAFKIYRFRLYTEDKSFEMHIKTICRKQACISVQSLGLDSAEKILNQINLSE